jgi:hypothetical protein
MAAANGKLGCSRVEGKSLGNGHAMGEHMWAFDQSSSAVPRNSAASLSVKYAWVQCHLRPESSMHSRSEISLGRRSPLITVVLSSDAG